MQTKIDSKGVYVIRTVSHQQGSWRWQVRGQNVLYRPAWSVRLKKWLWKSAEVLSTKVNCGNIRDGGCVPHTSLHNCPVESDALVQHLGTLAEVD